MARVYDLPFSTVYTALVQKVLRKGGTETSLDQITSRLTGYSLAELQEWKKRDGSYRDFFRHAPAYHPNRTLITGKVCGVQIETIQDPLMQEIRRLDRLVDWLSKGKTVEQLVEKYQLKEEKALKKSEQFFDKYGKVATSL